MARREYFGYEEDEADRNKAARELAAFIFKLTGFSLLGMVTEVAGSTATEIQAAPRI